MYYRFKKERLSACTSCIHALLHVPFDIRQTGPVWVNWAYFMERFCGSLVSAVKSRRFPYIALSRRLYHQAQLSHIGIKYDLPLLNHRHTVDNNHVSSRECQYLEGADSRLFCLYYLKTPQSTFKYLWKPSQ